MPQSVGSCYLCRALAYHWVEHPATGGFDPVVEAARRWFLDPDPPGRVRIPICWHCYQTASNEAVGGRMPPAVLQREGRPRSRPKERTSVLIEIDPKFRVDLGKRLAAARETAGLSQGDAAQQMGISNAALSQYEHGHRGPTVETLVRLVGTYGCTYGDVLP